MVAAVIGALRVSLGLDSAEFAAGASQAEARAARLGSAMSNLDRPIANVGRSFGSMGGTLQNASFQLQDLVVQIQSGTSATVALSQQLPQLLGGFGAFGAVLGLTAGLSVPLIARIDGLSKVGDAAAQSLGRLTAVMPALSGAGNAIVGAMTTVAENLDRIVFYAGAAAAIFAGRYVAGMAAAAVATGTLSGAFTVLRAAIMRTGFGILIVGAGELAYRFTQLMRGAGGFGNAMTLLGNLAAAVWQDMGVLTQAYGMRFAGMVAGMVSDFARGVANMLEQFQGFTNFLLKSPILEFFGVNLGEMVTDAATSGLREASAAFGREAASLQNSSFGIASGASSTAAAMGALSEAVAAGSEAMDDAAPVAFGLGDALGGGGSGSGGSAAGGANAAAAATERATEALDNLIASLTPAQKEALAFQDAMIEAGMSAEDLGKAKADIVIGGVEGISDAFGDFISRGLKDFKGFASSILDSFRTMLSSMISMAVRNRIIIPMQTAFQGVMGGGGLPGVAPGGGIFGGLGGIMGGLGTGLGSVVSGFMSGGFGGAASAISTALSGATASLGGFATALGAIALPLGGAVALFSFFRKKTKLLDEGIRVTIDGFDAMIETFEKTKTSRFWGLRTDVDTDYDPAKDKLADPLEEAYRDTYRSIRDMAKTLGVGSEAFKGFTYQFKLSLDGMTAEQKQQALAAEFDKIANSLARTAGVTGRFIREGETASQALARLSTGLATVNGAFSQLGFTLVETSLKGANAAQVMIDAFGSLEAFAQGMTFYFQNFYSASEQLQAVGAQLRGEFRELGLRSIPKTAEAFKEMVDRLQAQGRKAAAAGLIALAPLFQQFLQLRNDAKEAVVPEKPKPTPPGRPGAGGGSGGGSSGPSAAEQRAQQIADQREQMERRLLTLQGRIADVRARELADLPRSLRALQQRIWAEEDLADKLRDISAQDYASRFDFERAQARARGRSTSSLPEVRSALSSEDRAALRALRDNQKATLDAVMVGNGQNALYSRRTAALLDKFDRDGMPGTRT